jgi:hypothetical protein
VFVPAGDGFYLGSPVVALRSTFSHADDSVLAELMLMPDCAYPCMMIMINEVWPFEPYPLLALAPIAE